MSTNETVTTNDAGTTDEQSVVALPFLSATGAIVDPDVDNMLFHKGFDDATAYIEGLPVPWARHHARTTLDADGMTEEEPSYRRGYRAALYGYLRHSKR